jgi:hypothetical protein
MQLRMSTVELLSARDHQGTITASTAQWSLGPVGPRSCEFIIFAREDWRLENALGQRHLSIELHKLFAAREYQGRLPREPPSGPYRAAVVRVDYLVHED